MEFAGTSGTERVCQSIFSNRDQWILIDLADMQGSEQGEYEGGRNSFWH